MIVLISVCWKDLKEVLRQSEPCKKKKKCTTAESTRLRRSDSDRASPFGDLPIPVSVYSPVPGSSTSTSVAQNIEPEPIDTVEEIQAPISVIPRQSSPKKMCKKCSEKSTEKKIQKRTIKRLKKKVKELEAQLSQIQLTEVCFTCCMRNVLDQF